MANPHFGASLSIPKHSYNHHIALLKQHLSIIYYYYTLLLHHDNAIILHYDGSRESTTNKTRIVVGIVQLTVYTCIIYAQMEIYLDQSVTHTYNI